MVFFLPRGATAGDFGAAAGFWTIGAEGLVIMP